MTAEEVYVDPSALARLYIHQAGSREIAAWRSKVQGVFAVTHHGRTEIINAICRAAFIGQLDPNGLAEALADLIRSEPMSVVRRCWVLLVGQKLLECLLLLRRARQDQRQALESLIGRHRPSIFG